jgi:hypothetical protein
MIRLLSDSKNPAGAGIFVERRNSRFFGMMRVSKIFPPAVPLTWLCPDYKIGLNHGNSVDSKGPAALWPGILKGKGFPLSYMLS